MYSVKWFLDTNIILDIVAAERMPFHGEAARMIEAVAESDGEVGLLVSAGSLKDIYYILSKRDMGEEGARAVVRVLLREFEVVDVTEELAHEAAYSDEPDFEDGLIRAAAERCRCDAIVSRDGAAFLRSAVPKMAPAEAAASLREPPSPRQRG